MPPSMGMGRPRHSPGGIRTSRAISASIAWARRLGSIASASSGSSRSTQQTLAVVVPLMPLTLSKPDGGSPGAAVASRVRRRRAALTSPGRSSGDMCPVLGSSISPAGWGRSATMRRACDGGVSRSRPPAMTSVGTVKLATADHRSMSERATPTAARTSARDSINMRS